MRALPTAWPGCGLPILPERWQCHLERCNGILRRYGSLAMYRALEYAGALEASRASRDRVKGQIRARRIRKGKVES